MATMQSGPSVMCCEVMLSVNEVTLLRQSINPTKNRTMSIVLSTQTDIYSFSIDQMYTLRPPFSSHSYDKGSMWIIDRRDDGICRNERQAMGNLDVLGDGCFEDYVACIRPEVNGRIGYTSLIKIIGSLAEASNTLLSCQVRSSCIGMIRIR